MLLESENGQFGRNERINSKYTKSNSSPSDNQDTNITTDDSISMDSPYSPYESQRVSDIYLSPPLTICIYCINKINLILTHKLG